MRFSIRTFVYKSFTEQGEDKIVTFAQSKGLLVRKLKLAKFLYRIDKIEGPTIEDLAKNLIIIRA